MAREVRSRIFGKVLSIVLLCFASHQAFEVEEITKICNWWYPVFGCCYSRPEIATFAFCTHMHSNRSKDLCIINDPLDYCNLSDCDHNPTFDSCSYYNCYTQHRHWEDLSVSLDEYDGYGSTLKTLTVHLECVSPAPIVELSFEGQTRQIMFKPRTMYSSPCMVNYTRDFDYIFNLRHYGEYKLLVTVPGYLSKIYHYNLVEPLPVATIVLGTIIPVCCILLFVFFVFRRYKRKGYCFKPSGISRSNSIPSISYDVARRTRSNQPRSYQRPMPIFNDSPPSYAEAVDSCTNID